MTENTAQDAMPPDVQPNDAATTQAFSFGDPIPVLDRRELLDYVECVQMDRWYEPPVSFDGLARTYRAAVHHSSPIAVKRDILSSTYIPHRLLSQQAFTRFVQDYLVFGNAYLEKRTNRLGGVLSLEPTLAKYTRRGVHLDTYWFLQYGMTTQPYEFTPGSVRGVSGNGYPYRDGYLYSYAVSRSKVRRENAGLPFGVVETPAY